MTNDSNSTDTNRTRPVLICDSQPVAIEGLRWLLDSSGDLRCAGAVCSLERALELTQALQPAAVILDKALGLPALMEWLRQCTATTTGTAPIVWGAGINEPEALRLLQAGAKGILRRTAEADSMLTCLRAVTSGSTWMEDGIFGDAETVMQPRRSHLTAREHQVAELVERGLRNRDIARTLGIQTGTVKIHLKHIFEKTGVRGRYGLALTGLREKGTIPSATSPALTLPTM
jgi:DNA-binding NarL/FixJ family response regulator